MKKFRILLHVFSKRFFFPPSQIVKILLKYGADPHRKNEDLDNPIDVSSTDEITECLEEYVSLTKFERGNCIFLYVSSLGLVLTGLKYLVHPSWWCILCARMKIYLVVGVSYHLGVQHTQYSTLSS